MTTPLLPLPPVRVGARAMVVFMSVFPLSIPVSRVGGAMSPRAMRRRASAIPDTRTHAGRENGGQKQKTLKNGFV